jgi:hypothetical protein
LRWLLLLALLIGGCAGRAPVLAPALEHRPGPASIELDAVPFFPQRDYQCGPASLAAVLRHAGVDTDADALRPLIYLPARQGALAIEMAAVARRFGRIAYQPQPHLAALLAELQAGRAVVVLQNLGLARYPVWHFAVAIGYDAGTDRVILRSGEKRRVEADAFNFARTWDLAERWALVVLRPGELPAGDDVEGYLRAVAAAEATRAPGDMTPAYQAAVTRWPDSELARFGLANAFRRTGDNQRAIELYLGLHGDSATHLAARNNLADALHAAGCRALALTTVEAALNAASSAGPLRDMLLQTRREILAHTAVTDEPADCVRWTQHAAEQKDREAGHAPASPRN